jgi:hypothetical protein
LIANRRGLKWRNICKFNSNSIKLVVEFVLGVGHPADNPPAILRPKREEHSTGQGHIPAKQLAECIQQIGVMLCAKRSNSAGEEGPNGFECIGQSRGGRPFKKMLKLGRKRIELFKIGFKPGFSQNPFFGFRTFFVFDFSYFWF